MSAICGSFAAQRIIFGSRTGVFARPRCRGRYSGFLPRAGLFWRFEPQPSMHLPYFEGRLRASMDASIRAGILR